MKRFLMFFAAQFFNYAMLTWNYRAIALGWPVSLVASDMVISFYQFLIIQKIVENKSKMALAGFTLGGACGSLTSLYLTRWWFGQ